MTIFSIGYEGRTVDEFIRDLASHRIELLVDIRELPLSRKRGFSKSTLSAVLQESGIGYRHMRELGTPRVLRDELRRTGDYEGFFRGYAEHLSSQGPALDELAALARKKRLCLICFEKDPSKCHRSVLASRFMSRDSMSNIYKRMFNKQPSIRSMSEDGGRKRGNMPRFLTKKGR